MSPRMSLGAVAFSAGYRQTAKDYRTYVDVGTAQGDLAVQIALANPHLDGASIG